MSTFKRIPLNHVTRLGDMLLMDVYTLHLGYSFKPSMSIFNSMARGMGYNGDLPLWMRWVER